MAFRNLQLEDRGAVRRITINRPEKLNALSPDMYHALGKALARLNGDPGLRVAVLHAEGRHFTSGVELDLWAPILGSGVPFPVQADEIDPYGLTGERHKKPLVIAVQGYCFTWGVEILLNSEIRVAARDTQFQMLEVRRGLYPCAGAPLRLHKEIGWGNAHKVMLTGERWSADEAIFSTPGARFMVLPSAFSMVVLLSARSVVVWTDWLQAPSFLKRKNSDSR